MNTTKPVKSILEDMAEIGMLLENHIHGVVCIHCQQTATVEYQRLEHQYWCTDCRVFFPAAIEPARALTTGMVKDGLTGYVNDPTCTDLNDFPKDLPRNNS